MVTFRVFDLSDDIVEVMSDLIAVEAFRLEVLWGWSTDVEEAGGVLMMLPLPGLLWTMGL